jgi:hypothetical protein
LVWLEVSGAAVTVAVAVGSIRAGDICPGDLGNVGSTRIMHTRTIQGPHLSYAYHRRERQRRRRAG